VQDLVFVDVLQAHTDLYENPPDLLLLQRLLYLALQVVGQVAVVAVLHHDVQSVVLDERLLVTHDERVNQFAHYYRLVDCLYRGGTTFLRAFSVRRLRLICFNTHISRVDLLSAL
jgi:hypothetical protein